MKANRQFILSGFTLLGLVALATITGCQQPYSYGPYPQAPYGQPPYGQPLPPGTGFPPAGTVAPGTGTSGFNPGTSIPPISSVPPGQVSQPSSGNSNNAPPFNPKNPGSSGNGNTVPDPANEPSSPYFEKSSSLEPENTFVPKMADNSVSQAGFIRTAGRNEPITVTAGEKPALFEPPIRHKKEASEKTNSSAPANPFGAAPQTSQQAGQNHTDIPLAPPLSAKKEPVSNDSLEGTARKVSENEWILEFASPSDPFGGKLKLTGAPEVLKVLRDGKRYRLQGFIESPATNPTQSQFHIKQIHPLGISVAPTK